MIHGGVSENPQSEARSCVDVERLREVLPAARAAYGAADPFTHVVIDGFLRPEVARRLETEFPKPDHRIWKHHLHLNSHKFACNRLDAMPPLFQAVLRELNGRGVVEFLEALTGIGDLLPDVELEGGGLHQIVPDGVTPYLDDEVRFLRTSPAVGPVKVAGPTVRVRPSHAGPTIQAEITELQRRQTNLMRELEALTPTGDPEVDAAWRAGIQTRFAANIAEQRTKTKLLAAITREQQDTAAPDLDLLDVVPLHGLDVTLLPEDTQRRLFS